MLRIGVLLISISGTCAHANGAGSGLIVGVTTQSNVIMFSTTGGHTGAPACATTGRWAFAADTPAGKAMAAVVIAASAGGNSVAIVGDGTCSAWADSETVLVVNAS